MYKKSVLSNKLRVISNELRDRESVAVGIWVGVGGRFEDDATKGSAHFLEHILFRGSLKYSCNEIKGSFEGVGGNLNAFTGEIPKAITTTGIPPRMGPRYGTDSVNAAKIASASGLGIPMISNPM